MSFLPVKKSEIDGSLDFILISGDAYVDHPSFGHALISRLLESEGFKVGIIAQPTKDKDYLEFGEPNIAFLISTGVVDSMVNNYTASKKKRHNDEYSPGNKPFIRPDRALDVYSKNLRKLFPNSYIIGGGVEPSLRRFSHYDYWADEVLPSCLYTSQCDMIIYGAGEKPFWEITELLKKGAQISSIKDVRGTAYLCKFDTMGSTAKLAFSGNRDKFKILDSHEVVAKDKIKHAKTFNLQSKNNDPYSGLGLIQEQPNKTFVVCNPPQFPLTTEEFDKVYSFPYMREFHPMYEEMGGVKSLEEVKFSITANRGCYGDCAFCAITYHMGRIVQKRSKESILEEAQILINKPDFKGYIHDVGGPSANFSNKACKKQETHGACTNKECIGFEPCQNLEVDHSYYLEILRALRKLPKVKKVFIRSGIRFDYVLMDKNSEFFDELVEHHVSGQLKTAPEHMSKSVLKIMNKPDPEVYKEFSRRFAEKSRKLNKKQYIVPYFISSHPGSTIADAIELTKYLKSINYMPLQVQDFIPTPSTRATVMYYTGIDPQSMQKVHIPTEEERKIQRALLQYRKEENIPIVRKALRDTNNQHLIGSGKECIVTDSNVGKSTLYGSGKLANVGGKNKKTKGKNFKKSKPRR